MQDHIEDIKQKIARQLQQRNHNTRFMPMKQKASPNRSSFRFYEKDKTYTQSEVRQGSTIPDRINNFMSNTSTDQQS